MDKKAFITELVKLADQLDQKGLQEEASELDNIIKEAQGYVWPQVRREPRERGMHLPEWRKMQIERERKEEEEEEGKPISDVEVEKVEVEKPELNLI